MYYGMKIAGVVVTVDKLLPVSLTPENIFSLASLTPRGDKQKVANITANFW
jgi:hypothetical protein